MAKQCILIVLYFIQIFSLGILFLYDIWFLYLICSWLLMSLCDPLLFFSNFLFLRDKCFSWVNYLKLASAGEGARTMYMSYRNNRLLRIRLFIIQGETDRLYSYQPIKTSNWSLFKIQKSILFPATAVTYSFFQMWFVFVIPLVAITPLILRTYPSIERILILEQSFVPILPNKGFRFFISNLFVFLINMFLAISENYNRSVSFALLLFAYHCSASTSPCYFHLFWNFVVSLSLNIFVSTSFSFCCFEAIIRKLIFFTLSEWMSLLSFTSITFIYHLWPI